MNAAEVTKIINNLYTMENPDDPEEEGYEGDDIFDGAWDHFTELLEGYDYGNTPLPENIELVKQYGGEGMGEEYYYVFKVGDQFFRRDGFYTSYYGVNWDYAEIYEVTPTEVVVTEYPRTK